MTISRIIVQLALAVVLITCFSCAHNTANNDVPVPRRVAYHRLQLPDSTYRQIVVDGIGMDVNTVIVQETDTQQGWFTGKYPQDMATIYITVTHTTQSAVDEVIDNRIERLSVNTGGLPTEVLSLITPGGMDARMLVTSRDCPTPVQFLITDHNKIVVSGSVSVPSAPIAPADSLSPVIEMLRRDVTHLVNSINANYCQ